MDHRTRRYDEEDSSASLPRQRAPTHPLDRRHCSHATSGETSSAVGSASSSAVSAVTPAHGLGTRDEIRDPLREGGGPSPDVISDPLGASGGGRSTAFDDPLRATASVESSSNGPSLSRDARADEVLKGSNGRGHSRAKDVLAGGGEDPDVLAEWESRKQAIHQRFSGQGTIQVSLTFDIISTREKGAKGLQSRLEELEDPLKGQRAETLRISQQEYVQRLRQLNEDISHAWLASDRINALKLAIQAAKLLRDTSVPQFYPILFVMVAEIMDTIGRLVFDRIRRKAEKEDSGEHVMTLPKGFTCDDVRAEAKVTCRNWFYKIASLQELVPRIYMELALLRCYHFLQKGLPLPQLKRLVGMCRGVADPLVAAYLRTFLAYRGVSLCPPGEKEYLINQLSDFMPQYGLLLHPDTAEFNAYLASSQLARQDYLNLLDPALDWQLHCCARQAELGVLKQVMALGGRAPPPPFLRGVLRALPPAVVSANAEHIVNLIAACTSHGVDVSSSKNIDSPEGKRSRQEKEKEKEKRAPSKEHMAAQADCYRILGEKLAECPPPSEARLGVLREVWAVVRKYENLSAYLRCADTWLEYLLTHFGHQELNALLKDVVKHANAEVTAAVAAASVVGGTAVGERSGVGVVGTAKLPDEKLKFIESIAFRVLLHYRDLPAVLSLDPFTPLTDFLHGSSKRYFFRRLLELVTEPAAGPLRDPVALHFAFEGAKALHDALDGMSSESDRNEASVLAIKLVRAAHFGRDYEQHLNFLVSCRSGFAALSTVQEAIVMQAARIGADAMNAVKGQHSKKTLAFVKATTAFCQITIPSIAGVVARLKLFLISAEAALMNGLVQQADGLVRSAITDAQESTGTTAVGGWADLKPHEADEAAVAFARQCASLLVVLPGHPEKGPLYIVRGLVKVMETFPWSPQSDAKVQAYLALVQLSAALAQTKLPYHVLGIQSNDVLYAGEPGYGEEVLELTHELVQKATDASAAVAERSDRGDGSGDSGKSGNGAEAGDEDGGGGKIEGPLDTPAKRMARANLDLANVVAICCRLTPEIQALLEALVGRGKATLDEYDPYLQHTQRFISSRLEKQTEE